MWQNETVVHATEESEESIVGSVTRRFPGVDIALIAAYFLSGPVLLAAAHLWGVEFLNYGALGWRAVLIYGVGAPFVGYLFLSRSPRARFAAYVFLTLDIFRSLSAAHFLPVALDGAVLLYLQTGSMRRAYPPLRGAEMHARMRARVVCWPRWCAVWAMRRVTIQARDRLTSKNPTTSSHQGSAMDSIACSRRPAFSA